MVRPYFNGLRLLYILLTFACFAAKAQDGYSINGTVRDEKGITLPGATVFITNSKYIQPTNNNGKFTFSNIQPGTYQVIVKMLGFKPGVQSITVNNEAVDITIVLKESNIILNTVTINGGADPDREKYLAWFIKDFIGETVNSQQCKLLNPEVLHFHFNKNTRVLTTTADDFLLVENKALGYKLKYLLNEFEIDLNFQTGFYTGYPYFEDIKGTEAQQKKWEANRRLAYLSSARHFFRVVMNNTAENEGFLVYKITDDTAIINNSGKNARFDYYDKNDPAKKKLTAIEVLNIDSLFIADDKNFKSLTSTRKVIGNTTTTRLGLFIVYTGADQPELFYNTGHPINIHINAPRKRQISQMQLYTDKLIIDRNGIPAPEMGYKYSGYWAWQRIGDLTPLDYFGGEPLSTQANEPKNIKHTETVIKDTVLRNIMAAIDTLHKRRPIEKLYLQTDKPYYAIGDTLRFKAYLLNEALLASLKSGMLYVELINDSGRVCKRQTMIIKNGIAWGDIIIKRLWQPGNYTLRAYTNWMRNFDDGRLFTRQLTIVPAANTNWMVNSRATVDNDKNVLLALQFSDLNHRNIGFRDIQVNILCGTSSLLKYKATTDPHGNLEIKFALPEKVADEPFTVVAQEINKDNNGQKIAIPVQLNRPENIDLQFMPEGGNMVAGLPVRIGFKAIGEDGKGTEIAGKIVNSKQQEIVIFQSTHKGMGSFELTPQAGESYTAKISSLGGIIKSYPLPTVNPTGIALRVNSANKDSLDIVINASADLLNATSAYYLIGQARDKALYGAKLIFNGNAVHKKINKNIFPTGVVKFALLDLNDRPITQRIVFIDHDDLLNISLATNKDSYFPRDSIGAEFAVTDVNGNPVKGNFSLAITDDSQVKPFDEDAGNIANSMLLNTDLKGSLEEPGYYFNKEHADRAAALDNLLLTQGWASYDWQQTFDPLKPPYEPETEFKVTGRVSNILNNPIANTDVMLVSTRPQLVMNTKTGKDGRFTFNNFPRLDTISFHIETKKDFNVGVVVDEFVPLEFTPLKFAAMPWYINSDSTLVNFVNKKQAARDEQINAGKSKLLKEVRIVAPKIGPTIPTIQFLDLKEEEIRIARPGKKPLTLFDLLNQKEKLGTMDPMLLIIDGEVLKSSINGHFGMPALTSEIITWLRSFTTEDIKSFSAKQVIVGGGGSKDKIYLIMNVATNIKFGDNAMPVGVYEYRPMPISWPHHFYSPKYKAKTPVAGKDRRSTIFWAPNIVTNVYGEAEGSFYSADTPGTYTVIIEGIDLKGNIGYSRQKIKVGSKTFVGK